MQEANKFNHGDKVYITEHDVDGRVFMVKNVLSSSEGNFYKLVYFEGEAEQEIADRIEQKYLKEA